MLIVTYGLLSSDVAEMERVKEQVGKPWTSYLSSVVSGDLAGQLALVVERV